MPGFVAATILTLALLSPTPRVQVQGHAGDAVRRAVLGAQERLRRPECRAVLLDFGAFEGGGLESSLASTGLDAPGWLSLIVFADGNGQGMCRQAGVMFVTTPGSRVVFTCAARVRALAASQPERAELLVIHELLHTLGLPEAPPSSLEITNRVVDRCGPSPAVSSPNG